MCVPKNGQWSDSLRQTLKRVYDPTTRTPVPWLLSGEAALALQGVNLEPETIEFRARSAVSTAYFAQFMRPYEAVSGGATVIYPRGGNMAPSDHWRSNIHQRIVAWSGGGRACWLGRWFVGGITVHMLYRQSIYPDPVALAFGSERYARRVHVGDARVAVVPVEFLLAESAQQNQTNLTQRILHAMRSSGYDQDLLQAALSVLPQEKASRLFRLLEFTLVAG